MSKIDVPLDQLAYQFQDKPLLIGGMAMQYYGLRKSGADIDLVISARDHVRLKAQYPDHVKDLYGDIGICEFEFEIWNQIARYNYDQLKIDAIEEDSLLIISLERLLFLKALAIKQEKYYKDVLLLADAILSRE